MSEKCSNCRFGKSKETHMGKIDCFRFPPQVTTILVQGPLGQPQPVYLNGTPTLDEEDWCGEYQSATNRIVN